MIEWREEQDARIPYQVVETPSASLFSIQTITADKATELLSELPTGAAGIGFPGGEPTLDKKH